MHSIRFDHRNCNLSLTEADVWEALELVALELVEAEL